MKHAVILILFLLSGSLFAQEKVVIDLTKTHQKWEGWGVSLSWWANEVGREFSEAQVDTLIHWLTDANELNMRIFRFNIGGGDAPGHSHMRKDAQMPGYKPTENAPYDWTADTFQRNILLKINKVRKDAIYEAASYSPPYWMTKSGCSAGSQDGSDNLKENDYGQFADYLTEVVRYYKETYGIIFRTLSPVNEPFSNWWKENGSQEGCSFSLKNQERIIKELYISLRNKNMLRYTTIAAMDANSINECCVGIKGYEDQKNLLKMITQINTHSYAGNQRKELATLAGKHHLRLWQSESGPLSVKEQGMSNYLLMAKRIITDLNEMRAEAWCDWQYMSGGLNTVWGLVGFDSKTRTFKRNTGYYCRMQFSRFILPGYFILESGNKDVLVAYSPKDKKLVIVTVNDGPEPKKINVILPFRPNFRQSECYETTPCKNCMSSPQLPTDLKDNEMLALNSESVTTFIFQIQ